MTKSKIPAENGTGEVADMSKPPHQSFSKFSKGPSFFGPQTQASAPKGQFKPPAIRITQNKGGGGK